MLTERREATEEGQVTRGLLYTFGLCLAPIIRAMGASLGLIDINRWIANLPAGLYQFYRQLP